MTTPFAMHARGMSIAKYLSRWTSRERPVGELRKITAIVRLVALPDVKNRLQAIQVPGVTISEVTGYGEHLNLWRHDWTDEYARVEVYVSEDRVDEIARAISEAACSGTPGDGIIVIEKVERIYRVHTSS